MATVVDPAGRLEPVALGGFDGDAHVGQPGGGESDGPVGHDDQAVPVGWDLD
ncbi:hypothetical protein WEI85_31825 [Actinomycetes bacterium KLBMP 9797]